MRFFPAIIAFLIFAPTSGFGLNLSWHDEQRIGEMVLLLLSVAYLMYKPQFDRFIGALDALGRPVIIGLLMLLAGGVISASLAPLPRWAFLELGMFILQVLFALTVAATPKWRTEWLLGTFVAAAAAYSCGFAVAYSSA